MYIHSLGYIGVTSPAADQWTDFGTSIFGLEVTERSWDDDPVRIRWDDRPFRLAVHQGPEDTIAYVGWEAPTRQAYSAMLAHLESSGATVKASTDTERRARQVRDMVWFEDPFGLRHEMFQGSVSLDRSFRGGRSTSSFVTGDKGLGHAVINVPSLETALPFYEDVLGLRCSDIVGLGPLGTMMFMRCNRRHHSAALWERPGLLGLQHLMVESADLNDVGKAYDLVQASDYEVSSTMGRHTGDEQLSFYTRTPSGFDLEFGCDSIDVIESEWTMRYFDPAAGAPNEVWGHHWQHLSPQSSLHPWPPETAGASS
ncbi:hypothetical protein CH251_05350 [Rhodococcus sp. 06-462-5]|uniref:VOC family protein n=1 Tax=unclassified Rhodococcus (in: high G+C Gram-positive bacteria) TaxID=192944 RepID=UPI000B9A3682|nr:MULTISPECIES: VOC family protein [unclassified Rhodococcus (in: high G+C Gram-positive bacteria)]OZC77219.1 hypothetical protein CH251_05350 [Rhodococcus sp. 06-462-5]OZE63376.1 hypothetical protein CH270_17930 [Rhodococcus sp. 02-925g]